MHSSRQRDGQPELERAARNIVVDCLAVAADEQALVIADPGTRAIGQALRDACAAAGADAVLAMMDRRATHGTEPPATVTAALEACDVYPAPTSRSLGHTRARKRATEAGARGATMPGVTTEMLSRAMAVDMTLLAGRSRAVTRCSRAGRRPRSPARGART